MRLPSNTAHRFAVGLALTGALLIVRLDAAAGLFWYAGRRVVSTDPHGPGGAA